MPRFFTGDELGSIKSVSYDANAPSETKIHLKTVYDGTATGRTRGIQRLALSKDDSTLIASAHADGSVRLASLTDGDQLLHLHDWKETRIKPDQTFVGLAASRDAIFSCTSNGALRLATLSDAETPPACKLAALPSRLTEWRVGHDQATFAYGGDEVELSVWNTDRAFNPGPSPESAASVLNTKKRKRVNDALFPGEIWRAKNVPNDYLGLRQPVHNTCLTYVSPSNSASQQHLLVGTRFGDVRRYDTRAGRRPVCDFNGIGKVGGLRTIERGLAEHEAFVSDQGSNLFALDLRSGGITYSYKGISGAVSSVSPAPAFLASVALDRYARIHSTIPPPAAAGGQQIAKGTVIEKVYMTAVPTVVVWDQQNAISSDVDGEDDDEDVWEKMKDACESDED
ncbi:hypothetical protein ID866_1880 [Astraeus odoratus]|nr:hypothetical protein ID866_1880 [Astraeus odoratus]